jgi:hypothetical protein
LDWRRIVDVRDVIELSEDDDGESRRRDDLLDLPRREDRDEDELDRGAETGMTTPLFFRPERENLGAMALTDKSTSGGAVAPLASALVEERLEGVAGMASAHRPDAVRFGGGRFTGEVGGDVGGVGGREAFSANAVPCIIDLGLNALPRSPAAAPTVFHCAGGGLGMSSGEAGGLRRPLTLMKLLLLRTGGRDGDAAAESSTCCRSGLDTLTRLWRYDELLRLVRAGRGPKSAWRVPASVGGIDGDRRRAW